MPDNGALFFFDVKPVIVKAYGGHRFSAEPLVLERNQKTRGRFYLFALYDVQAGRVRWRYYRGKSSVYVCRFMRQVRRWYPHSVVWVVLDQDRAHPCRSKTTRRTMRELQRHWISLPKGSPDDNPCETLFSMIQLVILDNSNDLDAPTLCRRISGKFQQRNRRRDRFIAIPYL